LIIFKKGLKFESHGENVIEMKVPRKSD